MTHDHKDGHLVILVVGAQSEAFNCILGLAKGQFRHLVRSGSLGQCLLEKIVQIVSAS